MENDNDGDDGDDDDHDDNDNDDDDDDDHDDDDGDTNDDDGDDDDQGDNDGDDDDHGDDDDDDDDSDHDVCQFADRSKHGSESHARGPHWGSPFRCQMTNKGREKPNRKRDNFQSRQKKTKQLTVRTEARVSDPFSSVNQVFDFHLIPKATGQTSRD